MCCRRGRETGQVEESEVEAPEQLFDYVTEEEYSRLVRERQASGFILDDGEPLLSLPTSLLVTLLYLL